MRVKIQTRSQAPDLVAFLASRVDCVVEQVGPDEIEVSLLGSMNASARRRELAQRLKAWRADSPGVAAEICD
jgi:hypothetical protein